MPPRRTSSHHLMVREHSRKNYAALNGITFIQANLQKRLPALDSLLSFMLTQPKDIILIQEPPALNETTILKITHDLQYHISGYNIQNDTVHSDSPRALVLSKIELNALGNRDLCNRDVASIELPISRNTHITISSVYFDQNKPPEESLSILTSSPAWMSSRKIVGADVNATSPLWSGGTEVENGTRNRSRGLEIERFLIANNISILNSESHLPTFTGSGHASYIDASMASDGIAELVSEWKVVVLENRFSYHRWISFNFNCSTPPLRE